MMVKGENGQSFRVFFKYEHLPNICYFCGCFGHGERECSVRLEAQISINQRPLQYGSWLQAVGEKSKKRYVNQKIAVDADFAESKGNRVAGEGSKSLELYVETLNGEVGDGTKIQEGIEYNHMDEGDNGQEHMSEKVMIEGGTGQEQTVCANCAEADSVANISQILEGNQKGQNGLGSGSSDIQMRKELVEKGPDKGKGILLEKKERKGSLKSWKRRARLQSGSTIELPVVKNGIKQKTATSSTLLEEEV
ncbi:unnamed protein product [Ilex paraguariensis]|uniref:CCHC-type domain-containing protein n=1 Tax=Ilex paraguariensis TaxID=185542 RepID=A0ABC8UCX3_9AQUA